MADAVFSVRFCKGLSFTYLPLLLFLFEIFISIKNCWQQMFIERWTSHSVNHEGDSTESEMPVLNLKY